MLQRCGTDLREIEIILLSLCNEFIIKRRCESSECIDIHAQKGISDWVVFSLNMTEVGGKLGDKIKVQNFSQRMIR